MCFLPILICFPSASFFSEVFWHAFFSIEFSLCLAFDCIHLFHFCFHFYFCLLFCFTFLKFVVSCFACGYFFRYFFYVFFPLRFSVFLFFFNILQISSRSLQQIHKFRVCVRKHRSIGMVILDR